MDGWDLDKRCSRNNVRSKQLLRQTYNVPGVFGKRHCKFNRVEDKFTHQAESGDLMLFRSKGLGTTVQRYLTRSDFDHVAIVLRERFDDNLIVRRCIDDVVGSSVSPSGTYILEAVADRGVICSPWERFEEYGWIENNSSIIVVRKLIGPRSPNFQEIIWRYAADVVGSAYDASLFRIIGADSHSGPPSSYNRDCVDTEEAITRSISFDSCSDPNVPWTDLEYRIYSGEKVNQSRPGSIALDALDADCVPFSRSKSRIATAMQAAGNRLEAPAKIAGGISSVCLSKLINSEETQCESSYWQNDLNGRRTGGRAPSMNDDNCQTNWSESPFSDDDKLSSSNFGSESRGNGQLSRSLTVGDFRMNTTSSNRRYFCSELVAEALIAVGALDASCNPATYWPVCFSLKSTRKIPFIDYQLASTYITVYRSPGSSLRWESNVVDSNDIVAASQTSKPAEKITDETATVKRLLSGYTLFHVFAFESEVEDESIDAASAARGLSSEMTGNRSIQCTSVPVDVNYG